ncbi:MAG: 50S ribosomal protein L23 [Chloroflexi bacterium]|nr:50S ribosomal protein L23 [Chloroflexota bacterium]
MNAYEVIKRPILTEKTSNQADTLRQYTFEVDMRATKQDVRKAVETIFDVTVEDVRVMRVPGKTRRFGRHVGRTSVWKKASVTLAPGDTISLFEGV